MGHSMGARTAMTLACRYPERVDGVISVDAAPVCETSRYAFGSFAESVINFMVDLQTKHEGLTYSQAVAEADSFFEGKPQLKALVQRSLASDSTHGADDPATWVVNVTGLQDQFSNIPHFDESLRFYGPGLNIVGGNSRQYDFEQYQKIFPNYTE